MRISQGVLKPMKQTKLSLKIILMTIVAVIISNCHLSAQTADFLIFHTSDVHGSISPREIICPETNETRMRGGYAILKRLKDKLSESQIFQNSRALYFDSGDFFQGTPIVDKTEGRVMIDMKNIVGLTATTIGNHEFDYTYQRLKEVMQDKKFSVVTCNVLEKETDRIPDFSDKYRIYTHNGIKIGVTGVNTPDTPNISFQRNVKDVKHLDPAIPVAEIVRKLRNANVDYIILLSHLGYSDDVRLANEVEGIDIILGGHSHTHMDEISWVGPYNTALIHSGTDLQTVSVIELTISKQTPHAITFNSVELFEDEIGYDKQVRELKNYYLDDLREEMARVIGYTELDLYRGISGGDSAGGSLVAEAMLKSSTADFAFINFGGVRQPLLKGPITVEDVFKIQPFDNYIEIIYMTGAEIRDLIEKSLSNEFVEIERPDSDYTQGKQLATGLRRVIGSPYGYLLPANLQIHFDPLRKPMDRITKLTDDSGNELIDDKAYAVAMNDFIGDGGDGFSCLREFENRELTDILVRNALMNYIKELEVITERPIRRSYNLRLNEPDFN